MWVLLLIAAASAAIISLWGTAHGPATNEDSGEYICGAQRLIANGAFLHCARDLPQVWFPPFYSLLLAGLDLLGLRRMEGARALCALCFAASTWTTGALLYESTASLLTAMLGAALFVTMPDLVTTHLYAMSEAPFVTLLMLFVYAVWHALDRDRPRWLIVAGLAAAAASLTRYMGASLIVAGAIAIVFLDRAPRPLRMRRAAEFLTIAGTPVAVWMWRNLHVAHTLTFRRLGYYPLGLNQYSRAASTLARWFYQFSNEICLWIGAPVIVGVLLAFAIVLYWNFDKLASLFAIVALSNLVFIVFSRFFFDPYIVFGGRILVPILVCLLMVAIGAVHAICTKRAVNLGWQAIAVLMALELVYLNAGRAKEVLQLQRNYGNELSRNYYRDSALIGWLARLPADTVIYTDEPEPIYFFAGRIAQLLPMAIDPNGKKPLASLPAEVTRMHDLLGDRSGIIVYFYDAHPYRRDNVPDLLSMPTVYGIAMRLLFENHDGAIYEIRAQVTATPSGKAS